jgi:hypothetical protein
MITEIDHVIEEYVKCARAYISKMQKHFGSRNLLIEWREGRIPKRGQIGDIAFVFHGVGCTVNTPSSSIDFDFGPNGTVGGFDAFRLSSFANSLPSSHDRTVTENDFQKCLARLQERGIVIAPRLDPSPHLLYFASDFGEIEDSDV